ncbi:MFS transporter [Nocardioides antri]|uniref:MFS transporter n=1 Tax=Nocardioides antri TaxID=2607659 RepID=A0A5B1M6E3_9ACTN|nr:MFS transporter [Nocardioides antri]KAA1428206.1 MFS transporter [Nocardioides antri]
MTRAGRAQAVLAGVVALQLVAETALTPYWPLVFRRLFGLDELAATGSFLTVCRVVGLAALPLWGLAALRWPVRNLLVAGLLGCSVFDLALAVAPTWWLFTASSAAVVACGAVLVLAYPALVALVERDGRAPRRTAVVTFWAVFHTAAVLSTLIGATIVALSEPRWGLAAFAVVDLGLAVLVWTALPAGAPTRRAAETLGQAVGTRAERWHRLRPWLVLVVAVVAVDAAIAVPRPFLVELLVRDGVDATTAGWLFLAPAVASLAVLPAASPLHRRLGGRCAPLAAGAAAAGLLGQAAAVALGEPWWFLLCRLLFGAGTGVLLVVLDLAVFARVGTTGAAFSAVETGRAAALLAAPVIATAVAGHWLGAPLVTGAVLLFAAAVLLTRDVPHTEPDHHDDSQETEHVLDPVR